MAKKSKRIVVDASIARAASPSPIPDSLPAQCRVVLDAIFTICHRVAFGPEGLAEWQKHQSRYARTWLTRMTARKKFVYLAECRNEDLRAGLEALSLSEKERRALEKDLHLAEVALLADGIVLSRDEEVRRLFRRACGDLPALQKILWGNPLISGEDLIRWLERGAIGEKERRLGG